MCPQCTLLPSSTADFYPTVKLACGFGGRLQSLRVPFGTKVFSCKCTKKRLKIDAQPGEEVQSKVHLNWRKGAILSLSRKKWLVTFRPLSRPSSDFIWWRCVMKALTMAEPLLLVVLFFLHLSIACFVLKRTKFVTLSIRFHKATFQSAPKCVHASHMRIQLSSHRSSVKMIDKFRAHVDFCYL